MWQQYVFERKRLHDKNKGVINEMELFHGCGQLEPLLICNSMEGFAAEVGDGDGDQLFCIHCAIC